MFKNQPYVKKYENGILVNPITKESPYIQFSSQKQKALPRKSNNRKGNGLVVARIGKLTFAKYRIVKQNIKNALIVNSILVN
jgi:hypothetical protein